MNDLARVPDAGDRGRRRAWSCGSGQSGGCRARSACGPAAGHVDGAGGTVVPGFVDAHTHVLFAGDRAAEIPLRIAGRELRRDRTPRGRPLLDRARDARGEPPRTAPDRRRAARTYGRERRDRGRGEIRLRPGPRRRAAPPSTDPEARPATGLRLVPTFLGAHAVPPSTEGRADAYVDAIVRRTLPAVARGRLARFCDVFCEPGFFSVPQSERILRAAARLGLGAEGPRRRVRPLGGSAPCGPARARGRRSTCSRAPAADRERLARAGVTAVLLPMTAVRRDRDPAEPRAARWSMPAYRSPSAPTARPNTWVESMPLVLAAAVHGGRMTPAEALTAATVNAAHASGLGDAGHDRGRPSGGFRRSSRSGSADLVGYRFDVRPTLVFRQGKPISPP